MADDKLLDFDDLDDDEQDGYGALLNKIDTRLGAKFVKSLPVKFVMFLVTGGLSVPFTLARQGYQLTRKSLAIAAVKDQVESLRRRRGCRFIQWNSFPSAHIVIGGAPVRRDTERYRCPICKAHAMQRFTASSKREILLCGACDKMIVLRINRSTLRPEEILVPGICAAMPFTGELGDLAMDLGDTLASLADSMLDALA